MEQSNCADPKTPATPEGGEAASVAPAPTAVSTATRREIERHQQRNTNLKTSFVAEIAENGLEEELLYKDLVWYIGFVLLFIFFLLASRNSEGMYWNSLAVGSKAATEERATPFWGKTFLHSANEGDWAAWISQVVLPLYWPPAGATRTVMGNNIKIGALRVRAMRVRNNSCALNPRFVDTASPLFPQECFNEFRAGIEDRWGGGGDADGSAAPFPFRECRSAGIMKVEGKVRNWHCGGNTLDVPFSTPESEARALLTSSAVTDYFSNSRRSRFVMVEVIHYNPTLDVFSLSQNWMEISAGGAFLPQTRTIFFELMTPSMRGTQAYTVIFFLAVLVMFARWVISLLRAKRRRELGRFLCSVWNLLEAFNLAVFISMFGFRFAWWARCAELGFKLPVGPAVFDEELHFIAALYDTSVFLNGINTVTTFIRVLRFAPLNRRMRIVTRSIVRAQQNIVGLLVLFLVVLVSFALAGNALFGTGMEEFRNLEVSFSTLMRMIVGDSDFMAMRRENLFLAGIFYWSYMLLALFLLLNFIIAVIGNAFGQESAELLIEPLDEQIAHFFSAVGKGVLQFVASPSAAFRTFTERRTEAWARESKFDLVASELRSFREEQPIEGVTMQEYEEMPESEKLALQPDPMLLRATLTAVLAGRPEGDAKLAYIGERFLDDLWAAAVHEHALHSPLRNKALLKRRAMMADCAERQLRGALGLPGGAAVVASFSLRELLQPSEESVSHLAAMLERVSRIERVCSLLGGTLCCLGVTLGEALSETPPAPATLSTTSDSAPPAAAASERGVQLPLQVPKRVPPPL